MTDLERARKIVANLYGWNCKLISAVDVEADYETIAQALQAVRNETREEDIKITHEQHDMCNTTTGNCNCPYDIRDAIRATMKEGV